VCCSVLQRVAVCCSGCHRHPEHLVDKKVGEYYRALAYSEHGKQAIVWRVVPCFLQKECAGKRRCVAVCCSVLQCVAVCCSVLQCVAVCCSVLQCVAVSSKRVC